MTDVVFGCPHESHPIWKTLVPFFKSLESDFRVHIAKSNDELRVGHRLFLISYPFKVPISIIQTYDDAFVLHASDLPRGRGWSPHVWQVLEGATVITVTLLTAHEGIDTGNIRSQRQVEVPSSALFDEINEAIFNAELELIKEALYRYDTLSNVEQDREVTPTYYRKRAPSDSRVDMSKPLDDSFDLIRISDPDRFPAFVEKDGVKIKITLEKME